MYYLSAVRPAASLALLMYSSRTPCGDMILIPGDTPPTTIAGVMADELAIGVINNKTTATRLVPCPGKKAGEFVTYGGLFGASPVMQIRNVGASDEFVNFGGRIPAPLQSLGN